MLHPIKIHFGDRRAVLWMEPLEIYTRKVSSQEQDAEYHMLLLTVVTASLVVTGLLSSPNERSLRWHKRWAASGPRVCAVSPQKPHEVHPQSEGDAASTPCSCCLLIASCYYGIRFIWQIQDFNWQDDVSKYLRIKLQPRNNNPHLGAVSPGPPGAAASPTRCRITHSMSCRLTANSEVTDDYRSYSSTDTSTHKCYVH